ncbi:diguanylate cyclase (GGDEF)-like protein [Actinoplanes lutulentus]|uniref:Diguanylate cyclase (GGDEF)-like protein n=1 Tax=Actinoplanes lutulentus TaxID=1287878 RepID=A0A327Z7P6_9ACTN|nr:bifunctional diguanylate cyclase/phosphodiesterase [Actinoplanes lutulentus]MBB2948523.1 diguanylate cyclase (GGDEF)-like protein [Actinoplanes lutulentus]RAK34445.1 diguanylate cyclase (GGDEF)-like protein [Actinoplanes lutulentus]
MRLLARPARTAGWLVVGASGWTLAAALLGVLGTETVVPVWSLWPCTVLAVLCGAAACAVASATSGGAGSVFWRQFGYAVTLIAAGTVSQAVDTQRSLGDVMAFTPITGLLFLASVAVGVHALVRVPGARRTWQGTVALFLDIAIVAVAAGLVLARVLTVMPVPLPTGALATAVQVIVLGGAGAAVVAVVKVGMSGTGAVHGPALWILSPVGTLGPISLVVAPALQQWPHLSATVVVLPLFAVLLTVSAFSQVRANVAGSSAVRAVAGERRRGISAIPLVSVLATSVMLIVAIMDLRYLPAGYAAGAIMLILLVVVRQHVALSDNVLLLDRLADQARHDDLTGLPNRRFFTDLLNSGRNAAGGTVAVCDLDNFAALNDRLGDASGDAVLRQAGERIVRTAGEGALVARLTGDEFGILLPAGHPLAAGDLLAEALLRAFQEPLPADGHDLLVTVTVGLASGSGDTVADLLRRAELALQAAQRVGADRYQRHTDALDTSARNSAQMAAALRRGFDAGEFRLVYQPIVELPHGIIRGVEALVRWHPDGGSPVSPAEFIPVAEQTGLIIDLGAWILDTACADAAAWQARWGADAPRVSINVSARQLLDPDLPGLVAAALSRHGLEPRGITCEITETAVFAGGPALDTVRALREIGVGIALDDFGTGHSSLTLLRTCPVTTLKVDKSFIDELNGSPQQEAIAASLRGIADTLGLRAVAEGVETQDQADRLHALGYRYAQGFYFARPTPAAEIDLALALAA